MAETNTVFPRERIVNSIREAAKFHDKSQRIVILHDWEAKDVIVAWDSLRAALEAATRERGEAREERDFARNERDGYRIERDAALARLEEATAVIRRIVENHFARITEKGILVYGQPVADTGFSEAIEFLAQKGAPRE